MNDAISLRGYQVQAVHSVIAHFQNYTEGYVHVVTGGGKTVIMSKVVSLFSGRTLVIAHTREIVLQIKKCLSLFNVSHGSINGNDKVVVTTRQSLNDVRLKGVQLLVVDEAHHATTTNSYGRIVKELRRFEPGGLILGFTATPDSRVNTLFTREIFRWSYNDGKKMGVLVPYTEIFLTIWKSDWLKSLKSIYEQLYMEKRKCLAFFVNRQMSKRFCAYMRKSKHDCFHVDGTTEKNDRELLIKKFAECKTGLLCNVGVLTEGFDDPSIGGIILYRNVQSPTLMTQIKGRGLRQCLGKKDCKIVHVRNM